MKSSIALLAALAFSVSALSADIRERRFITAGMQESTVLTKLGEPDGKTTVSAVIAPNLIVKWVYLPHPEDQHTTTTITMVNGKVGDITRVVAR